MQAYCNEPEAGLGTLEDEESEPDRQAKQRDAPAALRKVRNSFTGDLNPVLPSRTRSGGQGGKNEKVCEGEGAGNDHTLCRNAPSEQTLPASLRAVGVKLSQISLESRRADHVIALQAASTVPTGLASYLSDGPTTVHEAKVSPEWPQWRGVPPCTRQRCPWSGRNGAAYHRARGKGVPGVAVMARCAQARDGRPDCAWCVEGRRLTRRKNRTRHQDRFLTEGRPGWPCRNIQVPLRSTGFPLDQGYSRLRFIVADTYAVEHPDGASGGGPVGLRGAAA